MAHLLFRNSLTSADQISEMKADARYDVSDNDQACLPDLSAVAAIKARNPPPKVPKVFLSNDCVFNCAYCGCRCSNEDKRRYALAPRELARLSVLEAGHQSKGIFITSAIYKNADYTEELIIETLKVIRRDYAYGGYIHAKVMPGTDPLLIREAGKYANRLSVNIEVAKSEGYRRIARQKNTANILTPMRQISEMIAEARQTNGSRRPAFATSQTTQLMAGSTEEDDRTILKLSRSLYDRYDLKRVYYTPFHYEHPVAGYDLPPTVTPFWRMSRLYQADRLMQLYGFKPDEIAPEQAPNLECDLDPKAAYVMRNLQLFPVEVNTADYELLLRVPGIGITCAQRILAARRYCRITFDVLRKIGVSLKRSRYFITCGGRMDKDFNPDRALLRRLLSDSKDFGQIALDLSGSG